jgi:photosystem II stability/assembly factor-like uncharacterized protein
MKNAAKLILVLTLYSILGCSSGSDDPLRFESFTIATGESIKAIAFIDGSTGCAVSAEGNIFRTSDACKSFTAVKSTGGRSLADIYFVDDEVGIACGDNGTLLRTSDGGSTWDVQNVDTMWNLAGIGFSDDEFGIVVGNVNSGEEMGRSVIGISSDQGASWNFQLTEYRNLRCVDVVPTAHAWILGSESLAYTTDGGRSWDAVASAGNGANSLFFVDVQHGWEVGDAGLLRHSTDGGWSWQNKLKMTGEPLTCVVAPEPGRIYVAGNSFVACSTNYGRNWVMDAVSHKAHFVDMQSVGHDIFVAGSRGELIKFRY